MTTALLPSRVLTQEYLIRYPLEAARLLESLPAAEIAELVEAEPSQRTGPALAYLRPDLLAEVLTLVSPGAAAGVVQGLDPALAASILPRLDTEPRQSALDAVEPRLAKELAQLMTYPEESAGRLMDPAVSVLRPENTAREALARLRQLRDKPVHELYVIGDEGELAARVRLLDLALAEPGDRLESLMDRQVPRVPITAPQTEVVDLLEEQRLSSLPVVDFEGRVVGVIRHQSLLAAAAEEHSADLQSMVGVSRDERALSPISFAVKRRLPWLNVNLLTAFLAAAVVGLFEDTIAQVTALAVLLPVVAGQSGNTGAQALAVTMRGLALREIRVSQWWRVGRKELTVGFLNGLAVALVTGIAVLIWSGSLGLAGVISVAMVISMTMAGLAGAGIPLVLTAVGQDPATAASIFLTTVTDIVGFFSFLGLATLAAGML